MYGRSVSGGDAAPVIAADHVDWKKIVGRVEYHAERAQCRADFVAKYGDDPVVVQLPKDERPPKGSEGPEPLIAP